LTGQTLSPVAVEQYIGGVTPDGVPVLSGYTYTFEADTATGKLSFKVSLDGLDSLDAAICKARVQIARDLRSLAAAAEAGLPGVIPVGIP
jgi:hypothetical protein